MPSRKIKPIRDAARESAIFRGRALTAIALILVAFAVLCGRFAWLQLAQHESLSTRSEENRLRLRAISPSRGLIYDRWGTLLADNRPAYRLEVIPEQVEDLEATLSAIASIVYLTEDDLDRFRELRAARRPFSSIPLRLRLANHEAAAFAVNRHLFEGVDIVPYLSRHYPEGGDLAHVVGYVGRLGPADLQQVDENRYAATTHIGKTGVERYYEDSLHGDVGYEQIEVNAQGRVLSRLVEKEPTAGSDIYLTIDARLQRIASDALGGKTGAVVAIDPANGEVLALVSEPGFDPNLFVNGISQRDYSLLLNAPTRPLFNRALRGGYEPGSTIKPYVALAGLELGVIETGTTVFSRGFFQLPGQERRYRDWIREGHGRVNVVEAIAQSVNVFFYQLAVDLGIDRMHDYLQQFGFGATTGIDLGGEAAGILPSSAWKRGARGEPWYPGETVIAGIGQGFMVTTPLQLAHAVSILAARGTVYQPHLLRGTARPGQQVAPAVTLPFNSVLIAEQNHWETVLQGMEGVLHGERGTARRVMADRPGFRMAGKSGTAQVYGSPQEGPELEMSDIPEHLRHHALFVAFAPVDAPRIAVAVVVEHGGGGSTVAAPVARQVVEGYLNLAIDP